MSWPQDEATDPSGQAATDYASACRSTSLKWERFQPRFLDVPNVAPRWHPWLTGPIARGGQIIRLGSSTSALPTFELCREPLSEQWLLQSNPGGRAS